MILSEIIPPRVYLRDYTAPRLYESVSSFIEPNMEVE
jgi:hypothetical protein